MVMSPDAEFSGATASQVIARALASIDAPVVRGATAWTLRTPAPEVTRGSRHAKPSSRRGLGAKLARQRAAPTSEADLGQSPPPGPEQPPGRGSRRLARRRLARSPRLSTAVLRRSPAVTAVARAAGYLRRQANGAARPVLEAINPLGRVVALIGLLALWAGISRGWQEFRVIGWLCVGALALAAAWTIGRMAYSARIELAKTRVTVGDRAVRRVSHLQCGRSHSCPDPVRPAGRSQLGDLHGPGARRWS